MNMTWKSLVTAVAMAAPSLALAQDDVMSARYGNTTITHTDRGHELHTYYKADHTFTGKIVDIGRDVKGTWAVNGGTLCLTYTPALPLISNPVCQPVVAHKVGDTWKAGTNTSSLVQGIK